MVALDLLFMHPLLFLLIGAVVLFVVQSIHRIGPTQVGLVTKRFAWKKLAKDSPVAFEGEAGYQADLLMAGLRPPHIPPRLTWRSVKEDAPMCVATATWPNVAWWLESRCGVQLLLQMASLLP